MHTEEFGHIARCEVVFEILLRTGGNLVWGVCTHIPEHENLVLPPQ